MKRLLITSAAAIALGLSLAAATPASAQLMDPFSAGLTDRTHWEQWLLVRAAPILLTGPAGEVDPRSRFDQTGQPRTPTGPDPFTGLLPGAEPPLPSTWGRGFHAADLWRRYSPTTDPRLDPQSYPPNYDPSAWRGDRPRAQFIRDDWLDPRDGKGRDLTTPADKQTAESKRAIRDDWLDPRDGKGRDLTTPADK